MASGQIPRLSCAWNESDVLSPPTASCKLTSLTHLPANTPTHWQVANPPTACKTHPLRIYANPPTHPLTHPPTAFNTHVTTHNWQQIQHLNLSIGIHRLNSKLCEFIPFYDSGLRCGRLWGVGLINGISQPITSGDISRSCLSSWVTDPSKASHIYTSTIHNLFLHHQTNQYVWNYYFKRELGLG